MICDQVCFKYFIKLVSNFMGFVLSFCDNSEFFHFQCEREYHVGCLRDHKMADLKVQKNVYPFFS